LIEELVGSANDDGVDTVGFVEVSDLGFVEIDAFGDCERNWFAQSFGQGTTADRPARRVLQKEL
jgi:hypothetical protein